MNRLQRILLNLFFAGLGAVLMWGILHRQAGRWNKSVAAGSMAQAVASPVVVPPKILYWYDPMNPGQHFDHPGKSPSMDMPLVARYAEATAKETTADNQGIRIEHGMAQQLGIRVGTVKKGMLPDVYHTTGVIAFNTRELHIVQARTGGFIEEAVTSAVGDEVRPTTVLAHERVPEWASAQADVLTLEHNGFAELAQSARQRLQALGMQSSEISQLEKTGKIANVIALRAGYSGILMSTEVRSGMTVSPGQTLTQINGIDTVWIDSALPQSQGLRYHPGDTAIIHIPGQSGGALSGIQGHIIQVLPTVDTNSRTLTLRIELPNPRHYLRPGMYAEVQLLSKNEPARLLVPSEAVLQTGNRSLVFLVSSPQHYQPVEVKTGREVNNQTEIIAGLQAGDRIVLSGQFLVDSEATIEGMEVRPLAADSSTVTPLVQQPMHMHSVPAAKAMPAMEGM